MKQWTLTLRGETWTVRLARLRGNSYGYCRPSKREIIIDYKLYRDDQEKFAEILIHECQHAQHWHVDESVIERSSAELAEALSICEVI